ncbi:hypothetical protein VNI00_005136 [Paramarasmius palmivorus]|uniref:Fruit-body specific protein a n=1 Tax=Paramarasmius palmivorus TaxID=297713 RepID=A0AAW0DIV6_9AGAR
MSNEVLRPRREPDSPPPRHSVNGSVFIFSLWDNFGKQPDKKKPHPLLPSNLITSTMFSRTRLLTLALLAVSSSAALVFPAYQGVPDAADAGEVDLSKTITDSDTIANTVAQVDQKSGAAADAIPNQPPPPTVVTAIDGTVLDNTAEVSSFSGNSRRNVKRTPSEYTKLFDGTGTGFSDRDGSIQGTAYLTFTVVPNNTYNVDPCLDFCSRVDGCVFANLYYEYNNPMLDWVYSEKSNLKCAIYGDIHSAAEKTNTGGQQQMPLPWGLTYIQQSSGYGLTALVDPATPEDYELVFGPNAGANNAPGYMGFAFLDRYDVNACAELCKTRGPDGQGGACKYFNIWRAVVNGNPTTYTCSMYWVPSDASTAVNYGQGDLKVTLSRGYRRKSLLPDGDFESTTCPNGGTFCYTASTSSWIGISPSGGNLDASIFHYGPYARSGNGVGLLGSGFGTDNLPGTLKYAQPLQTVPGKTYNIEFFTSSTYSGPALQANAFVNVTWNGEVVQSLHLGYASWTYHEVKVVANGADELAFVGGSAPSFVFIDDVTVHAM